MRKHIEPILIGIVIALSIFIFNNWRYIANAQRETPLANQNGDTIPSIHIGFINGGDLYKFFDGNTTCYLYKDNISCQ